MALIQADEMRMQNRVDQVQAGGDDKVAARVSKLVLSLEERMHFDEVGGVEGSGTLSLMRTPGCPAD
jgi:hypothetical protein